MKDILYQSELPDIIVNIDIDEIINRLELIHEQQNILNVKIDNITTALFVIAIILGIMFIYKFIIKMFRW